MRSNDQNAVPCAPAATVKPAPAGSAASAPASQRMALLAACLIGAGLVATVLYLFNPAQYGFYPRCLLHTTTGLDCPGCGGLRAAHQLLHGQWRTAFALNPLLVVLSPWFVWQAGAFLVRTLTGRTLNQPLNHSRWTWVLLAVVIGFGVIRNLPFIAVAWRMP